MDTDDVLTQLKKLREGRGLSADRIRDSPAVLSSLATSDPGEAYNTLVLLLRGMGESERVKALKVDFGLDFEEIVGRASTGREDDYLTERRSAFADAVARDVKTVSRWSDQALGELRGKLLSDFFDGHIVVAAGVRGQRVIGVEVIRYELSDAAFREGQTVGYQNPVAAEEPSLPLVLYGFPRDWRPASIRFIISFLDEPPARAWALVADSVLDVSFGHERTELEISNGMVRCRIENPSRNQLYGVWWNDRPPTGPT